MLVISLLIIVLSIKWYLIKYANMTNTNFGNILDRMVNLYLVCGGDINLMKRYKSRLYYNQTNYPDHIFLPSTAESTMLPRFKLSFFEYVCAWIYTEFGIAMLNQTPIESQKHIIPYAKLCLFKYIGNNVHHETDIENTICIHFRCSDIPFNRLLDYNIFDCEWYKRALDLAFAMKQRKHFTKIYIVSCNFHRDPKGGLFSVQDSKMDRNKRQCTYFIQRYASFIQNITDLPVEIKCSSIQQDLYNLHTCGCLICTTGSFAYYAGITSNNLMIVSDVHGRGYKRPGMYVIYGGKIKHMNVQDYYNKNEMDAHMKCNVLR